MYITTASLICESNELEGGASYLVLVIPEDVGEWLGTVVNDASQRNGTSAVHVQIG